MISLKLCRTILFRSFIAVVIISSLLVPPGFCQETEDSQIFVSGFNAYQQKDYSAAIEKLNEVLTKYPDTSLRDMALFWLARSYFKNGNQQDAARTMSQFTKEYPDNPLKNTVEDDILALVARYEKGEKLPTGTPVKVAAEEAARKAKAEQDRIAAARKEQERIAAEKAKAEEQRLVAAKADQDRLAREKAEKERMAAQKEQERIAAEKAKAEQQRLAAAKAELKPQEKVAPEKAVTAKAEQPVADAKAEQDRKAAEQAAKERLAAAKAEQERLAARKAELERQAQEKDRAAKAEQQRVADAKAEQERQAAKERLAAVKAEQERIAAARKAEEERLKAEAARLKQQQERVAAEKAAAAAEAARIAAARKEQERVAAARMEKLRQLKQREAEEKTRAEKAVLREKAIAQYKSIIEKYPDSTAADTAVAKLKELGITVAVQPKRVEKPEVQVENDQVLKLQVAQFAGFEFSLKAHPQPYDVARRISVPFEITNRGNGTDSFQLESGFPAEFKAGFAPTAIPDQPIVQTPTLGPGESFKGLVTLTIPASSIDGLRISYPVKASSRFMGEASQSREVALIAAAPLLRAVLKTDKTQLVPGEKISYRVAVLNVGSTAAQDVTFRLNFPPQYEPIDYAVAGFKQESKSVLVLDGIQVKSGESKEFTVTFQLKDDSLAGQELLCRAELVNNPLKTRTAFISNASYVKPQHGITVRSDVHRIVAIPGQTMTIPFVVTNTGNVREKFKVATLVKGARKAVIFHDLNRDGVRQANEPAITEIGPLGPKEEASILVEITTPRNASDGSEGNVQVSLDSEGDASRTATVSTPMMYSRPVLQMAMVGRDERPRPGEIASFDLTITNHGSNIARVVELQSAWPELLELVAAEPANTSANAGKILWKFNELGAGEKRTIKVSFRVKRGTGVGTNIQVRNVLKYEDQLGNRY